MKEGRDFVQPILYKPESRTHKDEESSEWETHVIAQEMLEDGTMFSDEMRAIVQKIFSGEDINAQEKAAFKITRGNWWYDKYGFPFYNKVARSEVLRRTYAPQEGVEKARFLQEELVGAFAEGDEVRIKELKHEYQELFPEQLEGMEALFGIGQFLEDQKFIDNYHGSKTWGKAKERLESLTEYNFLVTDFVQNNSEDKEFLEKFWKVMQQISEKTGDLKKLQIFQRSIVSQVAVMKIYEKLGMHPRLSHPREDAFWAVDMWADTETALQVKGGKAKNMGKDGVVLRVDTIAFPSVSVVGKERIGRERKEAMERFHVSSYFFREAQRFQAKTSKLSEQTGENIKAYMIGVPYQKIDPITGEPDQKLIESMRAQIEKEFNQASEA